MGKKESRGVAASRVRSSSKVNRAQSLQRVSWGNGFFQGSLRLVDFSGMILEQADGFVGFEVLVLGSSQCQDVFPWLRFQAVCFSCPFSPYSMSLGEAAFSFKPPQGSKSNQSLLKQVILQFSFLWDPLSLISQAKLQADCCAYMDCWILTPDLLELLNHGAISSTLAF